MRRWLSEGARPGAALFTSSSTSPTSAVAMASALQRRRPGGAGGAEAGAGARAVEVDVDAWVLGGIEQPAQVNVSQERPDHDVGEARFGPVQERRHRVDAQAL